MTKPGISNTGQNSGGIWARHKGFWLPALFLTAVLGIVYVPLWNNDFVTWDDPLAITDNVYIRSFSWPSVQWMWTTFHTGNWIPLTWMSLALDYQIGRLDPRVFHITNLLLHAVNTILVLGLCRGILSAARHGLGPEQQLEKKKRDDQAAFLTALLFAGHPIHVESVAWAAERKDLLYAFFYLSALWLYLGYAGSAPKPKSRLWGCWVLFLMSLMSKPMAVTLPAVLLALDFWPLRRFSRDGWKTLVEKTPFFLLAAVFSVLTIVSQSGAHAFSTLSGLTLAFRVMNAFRSLVFYIWKMTIPIHLVPLYPVPRDGNTLYYAENNLAMILVLTFSAAVFIYRNKKPYLATAWICYGAMLAPVLGVLQVGSQAAADRYTYLPSLAFFLPLSAAAVSLAGNRKWAQPALAAVLTVGLGWMTWNQLALWRNSIALWESVTMAYPDVSQIAHTNLANAYKQAGRPDDALREYDRAMAIPPPQAFTHDGKGTALLDKDLVDEAILEFKTAVQLDPDYASPHRNLWFAYRQKGMGEEALVEIQKAVELDPNFADAYSDLGISWGERGRFDQAEDAFKKALSLDPTNPQYLLNLATTYQREHQWDNAVAGYRKILALNPHLVTAWFDLGNTYLLSGDYALAAQALQTADQLAPGQKAIEQKLAEASSGLKKKQATAP
jgi:protein O-mannosyl-transferase